jgi:hypothetical protein
MPAKHVTLVISLNGNGNPVVNCEDAGDCGNLNGVPTVWRGKTVTWKPQDSGRKWAVVFKSSSSPFMHDRRLFGPRVKGGPGPSGRLRMHADSRDYEYGVFYQCADGTLAYSDPRIMVRDEVPRTDELRTMLLDAALESAAELGAVAQSVQALQQLHENLADRLQAAPAGTEEPPGTSG